MVGLAGGSCPRVGSGGHAPRAGSCLPGRPPSRRPSHHIMWHDVKTPERQKAPAQLCGGRLLSRSLSVSGFDDLLYEIEDSAERPLEVIVWDDSGPVNRWCVFHSPVRVGLHLDCDRLEQHVYIDGISHLWYDPLLVGTLDAVGNDLVTSGV